VANLSGFDASQHEPMKDFSDPVPKGEYMSWATESEMKETTNKDGQRLVFTWEIVDGEYKGRKIWSGLNLVNKNPKAVEIAQRELADICKACNVIRPKDSSQLHGIPIIVKVDVETYKDKLQNKVKGYKSASGAQQQMPPTQQAQQPAAPPVAAKPPWQS
jgi:hypothetical protein